MAELMGFHSRRVENHPSRQVVDRVVQTPPSLVHRMALVITDGDVAN